MIEIIKGDLLTTKADVICHQVNCIGIMGGGVALQIKNKYPDVYNEYKEYCENCKNPSRLLGCVQMVNILEGTENKQYVANIFGQLDCTNSCDINYTALRIALQKLKHICPTRFTFAFPYNIGCGIGGGNWDIVYKMLDEVFENRKMLLYKL